MCETSVDFPSPVEPAGQETPPSEWSLTDSEEQEPMQIPVEEERWIFDQDDQKADDQQH